LQNDLELEPRPTRAACDHRPATRSAKVDFSFIPVSQSRVADRAAERAGFPPEIAHAPAARNIEMATMRGWASLNPAIGTWFPARSIAKAG
jgi:hypothetical protein